MRIAYLSVRDSNDRRSWSGTLFNMGSALERHCGEVIRVGPFEPLSMKAGKLASAILRRFAGRTYLYTHRTALAKTIGKLASDQISKAQPDVIFAPAGSAAIAYLATTVPIVYLSDTTFHLMLEYNWEFSKLRPSHIQMAEAIERAAIGKAEQLVFPSSWAADSAISDYRADSSKVTVVPFGANIDSPPSRSEAIGKPLTDRCQLLFVGVNWRYKGGDIAFQTLLELERLEIAAELTIVGCEPPKNVRHPNLRVFSFLNKNNKEERAQLDRLYKQADFFILPTRTECFSIALCEANAYGLPVLSTQTGGLPELVKEGTNGFLFPLDARGDQYASRICEILRSPGRYRDLRVSSRDQFETRLNWDSWGKAMSLVFQRAVDSKRCKR